MDDYQLGQLIPNLLVAGIGVLAIYKANEIRKKKGNKTSMILFYIVGIFIALIFISMLLGLQDGTINN